LAFPLTLIIYIFNIFLISPIFNKDIKKDERRKGE
jgi:hypothetical protein